MTRNEKEQTGKYILEMAKLLEDGCDQQKQLLNAARIIDESLEQEMTEDDKRTMTNYEKFIEIFGETNGAVRASEEWLGKEYVGPVSMTEREKFLEWLDEQICIRYTTGCDTDYIYVKDDKDKPIIMVSDFDVKPGFVYIRIDGLCGWKAILEVKEIIRKVSRERLDGEFDCLWNSIFGR